MSVAAYSNIPLATHALMQCSDNFQRLQHTWISLLAIPGYGLWHEEQGPLEEQLKYIMDVTEFGVLYVPAKCIRKDGETFVSLWSDATPVKCMFLTLTSLAGWHLAPLRVDPPMVSSRGSSFELRIKIESSGTTLLKSAAKQVRKHTNWATDHS
jgi:hypothetical protein